MAKKYSDRAMKTDDKPVERAYFFPKAEGGPATVKAESREEAEKKLKAKTKKS